MSAALYRARRLVAILCLAAVFIAAATAITSHLPLAALAPLLFFFAVIVVFQDQVAEESSNRTQLSSLPVFSPRPPPTR
jgi:MFS superfamily sulfate permease-like transporter